MIPKIFFLVLRPGYPAARPLHPLPWGDTPTLRRYLRSEEFGNSEGAAVPRRFRLPGELGVRESEVGAVKAAVDVSGVRARSVGGERWIVTGKERGGGRLPVCAFVYVTNRSWPHTGS